MAEHRLADVEEDVLGRLADDVLLHVAGDEVDRDDDPKERDGAVQRVLPAGDQAVVDGVADDERDHHLRPGEDEHRDHRDDDLHAVGTDEGPDAAHDAAVEDAAEHLLLDPVRSDRRVRGTATRLVGLAWGLGAGAHASASCSISSPGLTCRSCSAR